MSALLATLLLAAAPAASAVPATAPPARPLAALPYHPGLDPSAMDRSADPCEELYRFSCGGWMKANPIPPDRSSWSVYARAGDETLQLLWGVLEEAARPDPARPPARRAIGDHFASCMDERAVERAGGAPLAKDLAAIAALRGPEEIAPLLGAIHPGVDGRMLFQLGADQDYTDATQVVAILGASGLGLPDRDDYLKDDARSVALRKEYAAHVERMLRLAGDAPRAAVDGARAVLRIETALAKATLTRVERRDPRRVNHKLALAEAAALAPRLRLREYLGAAGAPPVAAVNVTEPAFFREVDRLLGAEPLPHWKAYLRWHLVRARAPYLSSRFVREDFAFEQRTLLGVEALKPRWKRCVEWVDRDLGEALGQAFVERAFPPEVREATLAMARRVEEAMNARLRALDWLEPATKAAALEKLQALGNKVGYPDRWRDYGALEIVRGDLAGNVVRAARFETARQLAKIGKPVDRGEWLMTPATVNAYYNPLMNDMNFPAAVLLPPLFDPRMDLAPGYGNTGATIGHELVHAFDDEGRQYDARGNLRDWWTEGDAARFEERAACTVEQYARYPVVDEIRINSRLTLGEDLADLAGTTLAWEAWRAATRGERLEPRDGLTPEQRFFVGFAQWACANERPEALRVRAATNPHSPPRWRIDGVVANMPEFREAFGCRAGQALARERVCRVW